MLGTKGKPQNSNLILGAALSIAILTNVFTVGYSVHKISGLEKEITKQQQVMKSQGKKLEEQGVLTNQQKQEIETLANQNVELNKSLETTKSELDAALQTNQAKDKEIEALKKTSYMPSRGEEKNYKEIHVEATGYIALCKEGCTGITKTGINLLKNPGLKVIAVDPAVVPLNKKVWVEGYGYAVTGDTGGGIDGHEIDLLFSTESEANEWGRKTVRMKIYD